MAENGKKHLKKSQLHGIVDFQEQESCYLPQEGNRSSAKEKGHERDESKAVYNQTVHHYAALLEEA